jgi:hypothetical protein
LLLELSAQQKDSNWPDTFMSGILILLSKLEY